MNNREWNYPNKQFFYFTVLAMFSSLNTIITTSKSSYNTQAGGELA